MSRMFPGSRRLSAKLLDRLEGRIELPERIHPLEELDQFRFASMTTSCGRAAGRAEVGLRPTRIYPEILPQRAMALLKNP